MLNWVEISEDVPTTRAYPLSGGLAWVALQVDSDSEALHTHDYVASTADVDRYSDVIEQTSWRLANFRRNPVFLADHDPRHVIGVVERVGLTKKSEGDGVDLRARVRFDVGEHNPLATLHAMQHGTGFRRAVSVGFRPGMAKSRTELAADDPLYVDPSKASRWSAGYVYKQCELYELSSVAVPGNPYALKLAADGVDEARVKALIGEYLPTATRDAILHCVRRDAEVRRAVFAAALAPEHKPTANPVQWVNNG